MDVLIDRRELLSKARERNLSLNIVEKDYVLGWILYGLSRIDALVFKGGTALAKIYFPEIWRLSEDLDFSFIGGDFSIVSERIEDIFKLIEKKSGIRLKLKSEFSNPDYLQLKVQYDGIIGKNWAKIDITKDDLVDKFQEKKIKKKYSDYPVFNIKAESIEEVFCSKIRVVIERKKSRDYFDLWKLAGLRIDLKTVKRILPKKLKIKGIELISLGQIFPKDLYETLNPYWEKELGRLVYPLPKLDLVLKELREFIRDNFITTP